MKKHDINKTKLIQFISYLDDKDFKDLGLWVRSPFHNSSQIVIDLYDVLKRKYRNTDKPIDALALMKQLKIMPRTAREKDICPRDKQELRRAMHLLSEQIEGLLLWKATQAPEYTVLSKRHLMEELIIRRAYPLVPAVMRKARKMQETSPLRDIQHCRNEYLLAEMDLYTTVILKKRDVHPNLKQTIDSLRQYTLSALLRYYVSIMNDGQIFRDEEAYPMMDILLSYVNNSEDLKNYTIRFYYKLLKLLQEEQSEDYDELKNIIYSTEAFNNHDFREFLIILTNFCSRQINQGKKRFVQEKFELFKEGLKREVFTEGIRFSATLFTLIVDVGLRVNQPKWVEDFIEKYSSELGSDVRKNTLNYSRALVAFHLGKYEEAKDFLYAVDTTVDFLFRISIKKLTIRVYYDNNTLNTYNIDKHPINAELEALRQLARPSNDTKLSEYNRLLYANFANFFKRILHRKKKLIEKQHFTYQSIEILKTELANIESLTERDWLNDKLDELMKEVKP